MIVPQLRPRLAIIVALVLILMFLLISGCKTCTTQEPEIVYRTIHVIVPVPPPPPPKIEPPVLQSPAALASGDWRVVLKALLDDLMELYRYSEDCRTAIDLWTALAPTEDSQSTPR